MNNSLSPLAKIDSGSKGHGPFVCWTHHPKNSAPSFWSIERIALKYLRRLSKNLRPIVERIDAILNPQRTRTSAQILAYEIV